MSDDVLLVMINLNFTRFFNQACNVIIGEVKNSKLKNMLEITEITTLYLILPE